jgi:hypothetical protein
MKNVVILIDQIKVISHYPTDGFVNLNITEMAAKLPDEGIGRMTHI